MPFWLTYYHLVWATRNREELITSPVESRLYPYLISKSGELGVYVYAIGGCADHVHMVVSIPPRLSVADAVKHLKGGSAHMLNETHDQPYFGWQRGYGVLTLGQRQRCDAETYVLRQKEHHREKTANRWLERDSEQDEGPDDDARMTPGVASLVKEARLDYVVTGSPF